MHNRSLLLLTFSMIIVFGALHQVASALYFYWTLWWFDNLMHLLGGLSLGFFSLWMVNFSGLFGPPRVLTRRWAVIVSLVVVVIIASAWEVFEYVNGMTQATEESYAQDVVHDLLAGALGAFLAAFIVGRRKFYNSVTRIDKHHA